MAIAISMIASKITRSPSAPSPRLSHLQSQLSHLQSQLSHLQSLLSHLQSIFSQAPFE